MSDSKDKLMMCTTKELSDMCNAKNLKSTGIKSALVNRLLVHRPVSVPELAEAVPTTTQSDESETAKVPLTAGDAAAGDGQLLATAAKSRTTTKPVYCCVTNCHNNSQTENIMLHRFPMGETRKKLRQAWVQRVKNIRANFTLKDSTRICSAHFEQECFDNGKLRYEAVPQIFPTKPRQEVKQRRIIQKHNPAKESELADIPTDHDVQTSSRFCDAQTQTDKPCSCFEARQDFSCQADCPAINTHDLQNDNNTRLFTGLPNFKTFLLLFINLKKHAVDKTGRNRLNYWCDASAAKPKTYHSKGGKPGPDRKFDLMLEFFMTLFWYRHAVVEEMLAFLFKTSVSSVSRILITWTQFLYEHFCSLLYLPSKEDVLMNMPAHFINHSNTYLVGDCTEIFIEKPSGLAAQAATWSSYKHNNTIKFLVNVTPTGLVVFISNGWGGKASDRHIAKEEDAYSLVPPGMAVMVDKGFEIEDLLPALVELVKPPKVSAKSQMSDHEVFGTVDIAEARIVVEMKMEQGKNFRILQTRVPISRITTLHQIFINCFALTNLLPPLFSPACSADTPAPLPIYK